MDEGAHVNFASDPLRLMELWTAVGRVQGEGAHVNFARDPLRFIAP